MPFYEGTRLKLKHCVSLSEKLTGVPVKKIGGDQGYSGNDNRTFCKENKIETSFTQKGRTGKNDVKNATKRETCQSESDRDHADLLRYPHCKCGQPCKTRVSPSISCSLMFYAWNAALREWWIQT